MVDRRVASTGVALLLALAACSGSRPRSAPPVSTSPAASERPTASDGSAPDRRAQSTARNAIVAAFVYFVDHDSFKGASPQRLTEIEPGLRWDASRPSDAPDVVSFAAAPSWFQAAVRSDSGMCFGIASSSDDLTPLYAKRSLAKCDASAFTRSDFTANGW
jgi:hypothetical protein